MARNRIHNYLNNKRIATCEQLLADLWLERELRALEACEYALPVLEKDISEALLSELDKIDMPDEQKCRIVETY